MGIRFNADEIFEMAEQIERNGAKFYRRAAGGMNDAAVQQVLLDLAAMEDQHEKVFADMRSRLSPAERQPVVFDPDDENAAYLRAMAGGHVFDVKADPSEALTGRESLTDVLWTAIGLEKDSIVFYLGLQDMVPERLGKDRLDAIIHEEMRHIVTLADQLDAAQT